MLCCKMIKWLSQVTDAGNVTAHLFVPLTLSKLLPFGYTK